MKRNRPQKANNPFALRQMKPSKWRGLVGAASDGFLEFDSPLLGVRAGFINLFQTYYLRGFNTIEKIFDSNRVFPVYGDAGKGELYKKLVSEFTGINRYSLLSVDDVFKVGRAIERVEEGRNWVSDLSFVAGWKAAKMYLKL